MVYLFVGIGGMIGSTLRYLMSLCMSQTGTAVFPFQTLTVNLLGAFLLGMFSTLFKKMHVHTNIQKGINVGLIGSFTTFSAFTMELIILVEEHYFVYALLYIFISTLGGFLFAWTGMWLSNQYKSGEEGRTN